LRCAHARWVWFAGSLRLVTVPLDVLFLRSALRLLRCLRAARNARRRTNFGSVRFGLPATAHAHLSRLVGSACTLHACSGYRTTLVAVHCFVRSRHDSLLVWFSSRLPLRLRVCWVCMVLDLDAHTRFRRDGLLSPHSPQHSIRLPPSFYACLHSTPFPRPLPAYSWDPLVPQ